MMCSFNTFQLTYPIESGPIDYTSKNEKYLLSFVSSFRPELVTFHDQILENVKTKNIQVRKKKALTTTKTTTRVTITDALTTTATT